MSRATSCYATHYWRPDRRVLRLPSLPLSLTEDCDECIILPVLFDSSKESIARNEDGSFYTMGHNSDYLLPVLKKDPNNSTYKAIGVTLIRHSQCNESRLTPEKALEEIFSTRASNQPKYLL